MKSNYWIKLYHEINYDPKIFRLSDRLFRRAIQCFALAGEVGDGGVLPLIDDMAFIMRCDQEQLETELFNLTEHGILSIIDGVYYVTNFSKWQAARTATERKQNQRDSERKKKHYRLHDGHETVTICDTEEEEEKELEEEDNYGILVNAFQNATGMIGGNNERWAKAFAELLRMKVKPEEIVTAVSILAEKGYTIGGPWALTKTIANNRMQKKSAKPNSRVSDDGDYYAR